MKGIRDERQRADRISYRTVNEAPECIFLWLRTDDELDEEEDDIDSEEKNDARWARESHRRQEMGVGSKRL